MKVIYTPDQKKIDFNTWLVTAFVEHNFDSEIMFWNRLSEISFNILIDSMSKIEVLDNQSYSATIDNLRQNIAKSLLDKTIDFSHCEFLKDIEVGNQPLSQDENENLGNLIRGLADSMKPIIGIKSSFKPDVIVYGKGDDFITQLIAIKFQPENNSNMELFIELYRMLYYQFTMKIKLVALVGGVDFINEIKSLFGITYERRFFEFVLPLLSNFIIVQIDNGLTVKSLQEILEAHFIQSPSSPL